MYDLLLCFCISTLVVVALLKLIESSLTYAATLIIENNYDDDPKTPVGYYKNHWRALKWKTVVSLSDERSIFMTDGPDNENIKNWLVLVGKFRRRLRTHPQQFDIIMDSPPGSQWEWERMPGSQSHEYENSWLLSQERRTTVSHNPRRHVAHPPSSPCYSLTPAPASLAPKKRLTCRVKANRKNRDQEPLLVLQVATR